MSERKNVSVGLGLIAALMVVTGGSVSHAATVNIPNGSFESPVYRVAPYATPNITNWLKSPEPAWWQQQEPPPQWTWEQLAGVFYNLPDDTSTIDNVDGEQAAFLISYPGVELYQDLAATYEVGQSYQLTAAFQGGGFYMQVGTPLEFRLYYRDANNDRVTIATTQVLNTTDETQPDPARHLDDWSVQIPSVLPDAPWAGKNIGIQIVSAWPVPGYWRIDDVRLVSVPEPASAALLMAGLTVWGWRRRRNKAKM